MLLSICSVGIVLGVSKVKEVAFALRNKISLFTSNSLSFQFGAFLVSDGDMGIRSYLQRWGPAVIAVMKGRSYLPFMVTCRHDDRRQVQLCDQ